MIAKDRRIRVLHSFPHKLGGSRICNIAWHQVQGLSDAGADVISYPGVLNCPLPPSVSVKPTLSFGRVRIPYRAIGRERALSLHDLIVAQRLKNLAGRVDIVHVWPLGARRTTLQAKNLGVPVVLERPNAHTKYAYKVVADECMRLGLKMPVAHEHAFNQRYLQIEELEYELADRLLCPSDFVVNTFLQNGFTNAKLLRHQYGYDETLFTPRNNARDGARGLSVLFAGGCAPRKGLHFALDAWLASSASAAGSFTIAGTFIPGYAELLSKQLNHPRVNVLGHRNDLPELMRQSDILVLPSIEEGSALVTSEARGSGCVLLVSDASGAVCRHMHEGLVHRAGEWNVLSEHMTALDKDRALLEALRSASIKTIDQITWSAAGRRLLDAYREVLGLE